MKLVVTDEFSDGGVVALNKKTGMVFVGGLDDDDELNFVPVLSYSVATHDDGTRELVQVEPIPDYLLLGDKPETLA